MTNPYYIENFQGRERQIARAIQVESELIRVQEGFARLPSPDALAGGGLLFLTTTGTPPNYVGTLPFILTEYIEGFNIAVRWHAPNNSSATLNLNGLGPIPVVSRLENPVEAGDLVDILRVTFLRNQFILQELTDADFVSKITEVLGGLERGPAGLPGASAVLRYNHIRESDPMQPGDYRFRLDGAVDGVLTHTGLQRAKFLDLYNFDRGGTGHEEYYGLLQEGDVVVFFIDSRRWYAYTFDGTRDANVDSTSSFLITFLNGEFAGGTDDLDEGELTILFRFSRPRLLIGSEPGVTGPQVFADVYMTIHMVPSDFLSDPIAWPLHQNGSLFRNNLGPTKYLVLTIFENGRVLTKAEHDGYLYEWLRNGNTFTPDIDDPILTNPPQDPASHPPLACHLGERRGRWRRGSVPLPGLPAMRVDIAREDLKAQTGVAVVDLSRPFGHVAIFTAELYDDDGDKIPFPEGTQFAWDIRGRAVKSDLDCDPHQMFIDVMKGTEPGWAEDLYRVRVTLPEEAYG